ncbi:aminotransferase class V-fold PLP-dependent enzyme [Anatilimnocola floriformis]|uniref:aminotransferase class V-fold PLP-dependent enzyme n=1 Tax=Anatilimnocola floriformis TaxID=2948575 RepID=UPI0020C4733E|nr:aminotransferase class V-fold PLP-dependent enzyme [Anatilimnocola floriformis]
MADPQRIYLDNAATSWPKPDAVYRAVDEYQRANGAAAGRGVYRSAQAAERIVSQCRKRLADLIGAPAPEQIIFTLNGTDSLNLALQGILKPGDHVITSVCEHNSVLRPLHTLKKSIGIEFTPIGCNGAGEIDPNAVRRAITTKTKLIALVHSSNVTGAVQPLIEVGRIAKEHQLTFLVDAAQSLGHISVNVADLGCQLLAAPGHKGLLGPLGVGMLYIAPSITGRLQPIRQGGTGTKSHEPEQPESLPDRYESGNLNVPGIAGLSAGIAWLQERGLPAIHQHELQLREHLVRSLREMAHVTFYGPADSTDCVGVVSFNIRDFDPQEVAAALDAAASLELRAGLHCAPLMHAALGTTPAGTVRASWGPFSTLGQIDALIAAVRDFA